MKACLLVGAGGFLGALARHYLVAWMPRGSGPVPGFPWGVFLVNLAGCFLMGLVVGLAELTRWITPETRWMLVTGFLGSFTTFSTFGADTFHLWRHGQIVPALANVGGSVAGGLVLVVAGYHLAGWIRS